tara:strand:+ start:2537 stop:3463 length:927 start_codon:yes stop_codon:yes gene_type:complete
MKILVCDNLENKVIEKLSELGEVTNISDSKTKTEELISNIVDTDIVVIRSSTKINKDILQEANKLKIIARCGVGIDNIDIEEATNKDIYVTNSPNANIISVAELTIGLIISAARNIHTSNNSLKDKNWDRNKFLGTELYKKQLGLIGFGKAAREVAKRLTAFGMDIVFYDPYVDVSVDEANKVELDELLKTSDVISIHVVKNEETKNMINDEKLNLIKKGGILVNTSRGGIVDEAALFKRSSDDVIFAGLDVFSQEPPDINETFSTSNIVTTPHLGASTQEAQLRAGLETVQNISDILNGELSSVINI